jgi:hypothetical protein
LQQPIVENYSKHMEYVSQSDWMATAVQWDESSYSVSWHTFKLKTEFFFQLLDLTILNSWGLLFIKRRQNALHFYFLLYINRP